MTRFGRTLLPIVLFLQLSTARGGEVPLEGQVFTLPDGFEIEVVAKSPLVNRPITGAFDDQGRLYVADSSGSNDKVEKQLAERPHRILRLEDTDGDGRYDRSTVFADKMMFPEGTMWLDGSLYVSAPPSIWKLTDTNGDGIADRREEWLHRTLTHCANDLHGPYVGPDGWIYWCKGAFANQHYRTLRGKEVSSNAAHIFRARPDGSGLEPVMTGGMDNPVDVVFMPDGERIFSTTFLVHPRDGQRDGLIHAIYGGVYGKDHGVIAGHKRTGELLPPLVHLGPAAACGLTRYESAAFGKSYVNNLLTCCFNMHKVTRSTLTACGATFDAKTEDFLSSNSLDFHPTDVLEDADGSLLVINTGGWYKLCCPTSQLWKPDILGAIYRVRRKGAAKLADARGQFVDWKRPAKQLCNLLDDPRPAVRARAIRELGHQGSKAIDALSHVRRSTSVEARRNAIWALTRIDRPEARQAVRAALADPDQSVRQVALHSISVCQDRGAVSLVVQLLNGGSAANQRAAAEVLARLATRKDTSVVEALLHASRHLPAQESNGAASANSRRILEHALCYALIETDDPQRVRSSLASENISERRIALMALDQMEDGGLLPRQVAGLLKSDNSVLRQTASWILDHHSEWGGALAQSLRERVADQHLSQSQRHELERHLSQFAKNGDVQRVIGAAVRDSSLSESNRRAVLLAIRNSGLKVMPEPWIDAVLPLISNPASPLVGDAVAALAAAPLPKTKAAAVAQSLRRLAEDLKTPAGVRLAALGGLVNVPGGLDHLGSDTFAFLTANLNTELPVATRGAAADVLSHAKLTRAQLAALTDTMQGAGPLEVDRLLQAFESCSDEGIGMKLIAALKRSRSIAALRVDSIRQRIAKQPESVRRQAEALYSIINADLATQRQRIEDVLPLVKSGDVRRGQLIFARSKIACTSCHQFGYAGGHIGPDLTRIGGIRSERDLLESIMFPSASFVRSFEPIVVVTKNGKVQNGLVRTEGPDEIVLVASATETVRIPRDEIEELRPSNVSVMPAGLDTQLTARELADLVAFLKNAR